MPGYNRAVTFRAFVPLLAIHKSIEEDKRNQGNAEIAQDIDTDHKRLECQHISMTDTCASPRAQMIVPFNQNL